MKAHISRKQADPEVRRNADKADINLTAEGSMTSEWLRMKLDSIAEKEQTPETTAEFVKFLAFGYLKGLDIPMVGVDSGKKDGSYFQCAVVNTKGEKGVLYLTDKKHLRPDKYGLPAVTAYHPECVSVYIRDYFDSAIHDDVVNALLFNRGTDRQYNISKTLLMLSILQYSGFELSDEE